MQVRLGELRSPVLGPAVADVCAQLEGLVYPGFLTAAGAARLPALARYLRGVQARLDKLADNPGRDAQQMAIVHRVQDAYATALAALPAAAGWWRQAGRGRRRHPLDDRGAAG